MSKDKVTVKDLIKILQNYPEDMRVVVEGYEAGFNDITKIQELTIALNFHKSIRDGSHESEDNLFMYEDDVDLTTFAREKALFLGGKNTYAEELGNVF